MEVDRHNQDKIFSLLDESVGIDLTDDFNRVVLARVEEEQTKSWYKPAMTLAASFLFVVGIWLFRSSPNPTHLTVLGAADIQVMANLDLLEKMEVMEHLDIYLDTASSGMFLQLMGKY